MRSSPSASPFSLSWRCSTCSPPAKPAPTSAMPSKKPTSSWRSTNTSNPPAPGHTENKATVFLPKYAGRCLPFQKPIPVSPVLLRRIKRRVRVPEDLLPALAASGKRRPDAERRWGAARQPRPACSASAPPAFSPRSSAAAPAHPASKPQTRPRRSGRYSLCSGTMPSAPSHRAPAPSAPSNSALPLPAHQMPPFPRNNRPASKAPPVS